MPKFHVSLERRNSKQYNGKLVETQVKSIIDRALNGDRAAWEVDDLDIHDPKQKDGEWVYKAAVMFKRTKGSRTPLTSARLTKEMSNIVEVMGKAGRASKWGQYPWRLHTPKPVDWVMTSEGAMAVENAAEGEENAEGEGRFSVNEVVDFEQAVKLEDIEIPEVLIHGTDAQIEAYGPFQGIYGRAAHIRVAFSSIKTMRDTRGKRRNHVLFWGKPGAAKSTLFRAIQTVLGKGAYLALNANSATRAGIEAIFLDRLKETGCPPFFFIEEIEKTLEAVLTVWLSIMDERREVRKITHSQARRADANALCFATANDKYLFDRLMGGRPGHPGALSSRFNKPLYVPRPNRDQMKKILLRDINLYGGNKQWADSCLEIAEEMGETDPRIILGFLDGGERLLTGEYKEDILMIHRQELEDQKKNPDPDE